MYDINIIFQFSFHVETSSKNNGNELTSPLDCLSFSSLNLFEKINPQFLSMPFVKELFATFFTTSFTLPKKLR